MERASVFDQGPEIDISGFKPRTAVKPAAQPDQVKAISETANFVSREPARSAPPVARRSGELTQNSAPAPVARSAETRTTREAQREPIIREPRRHRTGRNIQLNIKARAETIDRFYALADRNGWVLGEAFEHAIAALERTAAN